MESTELSELLAVLSRRHRVPGAQLAVFRDGETVTAESGVTDQTTGEPIDASANVPIGSITKTCTATLAMILVSDGDLELDTPVGQMLTGFGEPGSRDLLARVTPRQLLSHTAGLPSDPDESATSLRQVLEHAAGTPPLFPPGGGFSYSNIGYLLVGSLIEEITGMAWMDAVRSILLRPLDIDASFLGSPEAQVVPGHAVLTATGQVRIVEQVLAPVLAPAGALAMSARDLVRLGRIHLGFRPELVDAETSALMRQPVGGADPFGLADGWGLGLAVYHTGERTSFGHDGTADGTSCHLRLDPAREWVVALTTNGSTGVTLWEDLAAELCLAGAPVAHRRRGHDPARSMPVPSSCFGVYQNGGIEYSVVPQTAGTPFLVVDGERYHELTMDDSWAFSVLNPESGKPTPCGRFLRNPDTGEITGIQTGGRVARRRLAYS